MREIKFRAKVKWNGNHYESGQWVIGHYAYFNGQHQLYDCEENYAVGLGDCTRYEWVEIDEKTLAQYTGLKDKNGVEIYERDIVRYERPLTFPNGEHGTWNGGLREVNDIRNLNFPEADAQYVEVIGNIYENPELLESKS